MAPLNVSNAGHQTQPIPAVDVEAPMGVISGEGELFEADGCCWAQDRTPPWWQWRVRSLIDEIDFNLSFRLAPAQPETPAI